MIRPVLRATQDGSSVTDLVEVGDGWETWNAAIGASVGEIVRTRDGKHELWVNENGIAEGCVVNVEASKRVGVRILGDAILFEEGQIE